MKILVLSDSHYHTNTLERIIRQHSDAGCIVFLGDGESDINAVSLRYQNKAFVFLRGNCDPDSFLPLTRSFEADHVRFFCTHGHRFGVKDSLAPLKAAARNEKADVALFGHTHKPTLLQEEGLAVLNPGSVANGCYGIVDTNGGDPQLFLCQL